MTKALNILANSFILGGGTTFYLMLFTTIGDGVKQIDQFGKASYYAIKISLALIVAGSLFNLLFQTTPPFSEVIMNLGFGGIFLWAAVFHARKFGILKS